MMLIFKKIALILVAALSFEQFATAQTTISGKVKDAASGQPLESVTVVLLPSQATANTNERGRFFLKVGKGIMNSIRFSSVGYDSKTISIDEWKRSGFTVSLFARSIELNAVTVSSDVGDLYRPISKTDIAMRGVNNSQEVLRIIPGIVIGQHQGGGKAEQIFLRGFDCDHGTDFREDVDGLPINMPSHAHGQGFADSHFIIPETIGSVDFKKGPYAAAKGDFATTGFVDFHTKNILTENSIRLEGGMFETYRISGLFNLLKEDAKEKEQSWYVASEYRYSNSYFDNPQHFKRFNLFTKYNGKLSAHSFLTASATTFRSQWNASGQIPGRAVAEHLIGYFGALDPNEGGVTYRTNLNAQVVTALDNGDLIKNQVYFSNYHFDLHTDFTFFLVDTVNGDEIRQKEQRNLVGYNGSYEHSGYWGNTKITAEAGLNVRGDLTSNTELSHTKDRYTLLNRIKLGDIREWDFAPYLSGNIVFSPHFSMNAGLRFDQFYHAYQNKFAGDTTLPGIGIYKADANRLSPKLSFYYHVNDQTQFYLATGRGFHSNDTRAVVVEHGVQVLPAAYSADLGTVCKPFANMLINAAIWYIYLEQEFVYGGDGGTVDFNGKTKRFGFDFSGRYEPVKALYIDLDVNYAHGRAAGVAKGFNYIPLAPVWTSSAGLTYTAKNGLNGSLRYRYISNRPANDNYSLTAVGYFVTDAVINYTKRKYEIGLVINNVLNTKWKETQFDTITRLKGEAQPVDEVCFTPGTPFSAKLSFTVNF